MRALVRIHARYNEGPLLQLGLVLQFRVRVKVNV